MLSGNLTPWELDNRAVVHVAHATGPWSSLEISLTPGYPTRQCDPSAGPMSACRVMLTWLIFQLGPTFPRANDKQADMRTPRHADVARRTSAQRPPAQVNIKTSLFPRYSIAASKFPSVSEILNFPTATLTTLSALAMSHSVGFSEKRWNREMYAKSWRYF